MPIKTGEALWSTAMSSGAGSPCADEFRVGHNAAQHAPAAESLLPTSETPYANRQVTDELREVVVRVSSLSNLRLWTTHRGVHAPPVDDSRLPTLSGEDPDSPRPDGHPR
jgi:hypothetical protein